MIEECRLPESRLAEWILIVVHQRNLGRQEENGATSLPHGSLTAPPPPRSTGDTHVKSTGDTHVNRQQTLLRLGYVWGHSSFGIYAQDESHDGRRLGDSRPWFRGFGAHQVDWLSLELVPRALRPLICFFGQQTSSIKESSSLLIAFQEFFLAEGSWGTDADQVIDARFTTRTYGFVQILSWRTGYRDANSDT